MSITPAFLRQEVIDTFYHAHGQCCAGCDWWRSLNSMAGLCTRSSPVSGRERAAMLGISGSSLSVGAGHVFTPRDHVCGEFRDHFNWATLSPRYLRRIGYHPAPPGGRKDCIRDLGLIDDLCRASMQEEGEGNG